MRIDNMIRIFFLLLFTVANCNESAGSLKCKPRPGCSIARCDPRPSRFFENGIISDDYSILCEKSESADASETPSKIAAIETNLSKLEERIERNEVMEVEFKSKINSLENNNGKLKKDVKTMKTDTKQEITSLKRKNRELEEEMIKLKAEARDNTERLEDAMKTTTQLHERIRKLEELVTKTNAPLVIQPTTRMVSAIPDTADKVLCDEGFSYRGQCYFANIQQSRVVSHQTGTALCAAKGGQPADILSYEHEKLAGDHIRSKTTRDRIVYLWVGMTYTPSTSTLRWSTGTKVPDDVASVIGSFPHSQPHWNKVAISVSFNTFSLFNHPSTASLHGVLCQ